MAVRLSPGAARVPAGGQPTGGRLRLLQGVRPAGGRVLQRGGHLRLPQGPVLRLQLGRPEVRTRIVCV